MSTSPWKLVMYGLIIVLGILFAAPNIVSSDRLERWPNWLPTKQVALGLDLKGGAHLVLEIDAESLRDSELRLRPTDADVLERQKNARPELRCGFHRRRSNRGKHASSAGHVGDT